MQLDDTLIIYDGLLRPTGADGGGLPPALTRSGAAKVFIVPSPASSRGRPGRTVNVSSGLHPSRAAALQAVTLEDIVLIGLGHDPSLAQAVKTQIAENFPVFAKFAWRPLAPIAQRPNRAGGEDYVEYYLLGAGPGVLDRPGPARARLSWVGPFPPYPDKAMRLGKCEHCAGKGSSAEMSGCPVYINVRQRRLTQLPAAVLETPKKRLSQADRLMGEFSDDDAAKVDADSDSECSEGEGDDDEGMTDDDQKATPKVIWRRLYGQGMCSDAWLAMLEALVPSVIVLVARAPEAGPTFQFCFVVVLVCALPVQKTGPPHFVRQTANTNPAEGADHVERRPDACRCAPLRCPIRDWLCEVCRLLPCGFCKRRGRRLDHQADENPAVRAFGCPHIAHQGAGLQGVPLILSGGRQQDCEARWADGQTTSVYARPQGRSRAPGRSRGLGRKQHFRHPDDHHRWQQGGQAAPIPDQRAAAGL